MKLVLHKPLVRPEHKYDNRYYLGFGYLKAYLQQYLPQVEVQVVYDLADIRAAAPDAVGFTTITDMWPRVLAAHRDLREWFDGPVFFGGPHITALPRLLPRGNNIAFIGEAEQSLLDVARRMLQGDNLYRDPLPGTAAWNGDEFLTGPPARLLDINELPPPADVPVDHFPLTTVRGCPFHCTHCVEHSIQGRPRQLSAERLAELVIGRYESHGTTVFEMLDDLFLVSPKRMAAFVDILDRRGLLGRFQFQRLSLVAHKITEDVARMLARMNLWGTGMGVESADPEILHRFKNGVVTREHIERAIDLCTKHGVTIGGSMVLGYPGETETQMRNTIDFFADRIRKTTFACWGLFVCQPLPGSVLWSRALQEGRVGLDMDFSTLRIDADVEHFDSEWFYNNQAALPRRRFLEILREYDFVQPGYFVKDAATLGSPKTDIFSRDRYAPPDVARKRTTQTLRQWKATDGRPIAVFGAGEHTRKILPALVESPVTIAAIVDDDPRRIGKRLGDYEIVSTDDMLTPRYRGHPRLFRHAPGGNRPPTRPADRRPIPAPHHLPARRTPRLGRPSRRPRRPTGMIP